MFIKILKVKGTYSTKTKTRNKALVEETVIKEGDCRNRVDYRKHIVELERTFSRPVVRLQLTFIPRVKLV